MIDSLFLLADMVVRLRGWGTKADDCEWSWYELGTAKTATLSANVMKSRRAGIMLPLERIGLSVILILNVNSRLAMARQLTPLSVSWAR